MIKILNSCGYNSALSFKLVDDKKLDELEKFVEKSHRKVADQFEEYREMKPFEFLPGHRALIFGIKEELLDLQSRKKQKVTKSKKQNHVENEETLKISLINQISSYAQKNELNLNWSDCITDFKLTSTENSTFAVCKMACPDCHTALAMRYDKNWKTSNMTRHLRVHSNKSTASNSSSLDSSSSFTNTSQNSKSNFEVISVQVLPNRFDESTLQQSDDFYDASFNDYIAEEYEYAD